MIAPGILASYVGATLADQKTNVDVLCREIDSDMNSKPRSQIQYFIY